MQVARLVRAPATDRAALGLDRDRLCVVGGARFERVDTGFGQAQVDLRAVERLVFRRVVELAQHAFAELDCIAATGDAEHVAAIGDLDAEAQFDLAQVLVERSGEVGETRAVGGIQREVVMGEAGHRRARLARASPSRQRRRESGRPWCRHCPKCSAPARQVRLKFRMPSRPARPAIMGMIIPRRNHAVQGDRHG